MLPDASTGNSLYHGLKFRDVTQRRYGFSHCTGIDLLSDFAFHVTMVTHVDLFVVFSIDAYRALPYFKTRILRLRVE